jgi:hypothetical protein
MEPSFLTASCRRQKSEARTVGAIFCARRQKKEDLMINLEPPEDGAPSSQGDSLIDRLGSRLARRFVVDSLLA